MGGWSQFFWLCFLVHFNVFGWVAWVVDVSTNSFKIWVLKKGKRKKDFCGVTFYK
jgi:hypothetical protein